MPAPVSIPAATYDLVAVVRFAFFYDIANNRQSATVVTRAYRLVNGAPDWAPATVSDTIADLAAFVTANPSLGTTQAALRAALLPAAVAWLQAVGKLPSAQQT